MRFGCCLNMLSTQPDGTGAEHLDTLKAAGYDYVELPLAEMCAMPEDGQEILVVTRWGIGTDCCSVDGDGVNNLLELENRGDWDGVIAWAEMPKYKQEAER